MPDTLAPPRTVRPTYDTPADLAARLEAAEARGRDLERHMSTLTLLALALGIVIGAGARWLAAVAS